MRQTRKTHSLPKPPHNPLITGAPQHKTSSPIPKLPLHLTRLGAIRTTPTPPQICLLHTTTPPKPNKPIVFPASYGLAIQKPPVVLRQSLLAPVTPTKPANCSMILPAAIRISVPPSRRFAAVSSGPLRH